MASKATWIWYPGDYEIWLGNKMNNRRTERGAFFPPFWKQDSHYVTVEFSKVVNLVEDETVALATEGNYNIKIDGKMLFGMPKEFSLSAGTHHINIKIHNQCSPPALFIAGKTINTDGSWNVTFEDKEWIDESGKASDTLSTVYRPAGFWNFNTIDDLPSKFKLSHRHDVAVNHVDGIDGLYDFGKETFGYVKLHNIKGSGEINLFYGESVYEARDKDFCETLDKLIVKDNVITDLVTGKSVQFSDVYTLENCKAFRYVFVETKGCSVGNVSMDYEYMPEQEKGSFRCNDEEINSIWNIAAYTMQLTAREFFIDGIKRDRWVWSGDASQSYLMNFYLFNDSDMVKRTTWLLGGKLPITSHINTIMDYTFFWLNSIYDYYLYSGDRLFLQQIYPMMQSYIDFVLNRTDKDGMVEGMAGDWVFIDWADKPMDKHGQLAFEQILFTKSLKAIAAVAEIIGDSEGCDKYRKLADDLGAKLIPYFWNDDKQALIHNRIDGKQCDSLFRYPNIFAVLFGYLSKEQQETVKRTVILNDDILKITTPYMRFYELESLCILGEHCRVLNEIKDYWGGMLKEGATTFWEKYNPDEHGAMKYAMYGRPYGKSLCHAWGASPIYLLGKYFLGVKPTSPGYEEFTVSPALGGLDWFEGSVPTPFGSVYVKMNKNAVTVKSDGGKGTLVLNGGERTIDIPVGKEITVML
ncbi:MAG: alpha-rhamnosidase [Prevotella sp.]|nr:alpha-rhamnosidase [Prevotella sp.]